jgi:hypothetical protein
MQARRRATALLLAAVSIWLAATLGTAAFATRVIEQDSAFYCHVAERFADGEGLTSLVDRRGPRDDAVQLPLPFHGNTVYPALLGALTALTGDAAHTGALLGVLALIGAVWIATGAIATTLQVPAWLAALAATAALLHRDACQTAVLPLTDTLSLLLNAAVVWSLARPRPLVAIALAALAVAVRFQNVALLLPLAGALLARRPRALVLLVAAGAVAAAAATGARALEGVAVFVDPLERDSLPRAVRFLLPGLIAGVGVLRAAPAARPWWLLGLGHFFVLLASYDSSDSRPWLFAQRHGLPFHLVAAALGAAALARARAPALRWPLALCLALALVDNVPKPLKVLASRSDVSARADLALALAHTAEQPLPADAVLASQDADVFALRSGVRGVHLRNHDPDPGLAARLRGRGVSHVLLTWQDNEHMQRRNAWMDGLEACLRPRAEVLYDSGDSAGKARALLLRLTP